MEREQENVSEVESGENIPTSEPETATGIEFLANESENDPLSGIEFLANESENDPLSEIESECGNDDFESVCLSEVESDISLRGIESDETLSGDEPVNELPIMESGNVFGAESGNMSDELQGPPPRQHFQPNGNLDDNYAGELLEITMLRQRERQAKIEIQNLRSQLKDIRNQLGLPDPDEFRRASGDSNDFPSTMRRFRGLEDPFLDFDINRGLGLNIAERGFIWLAHNYLRVLARIMTIGHRSLQFVVGDLAGFILAILIRKFGYTFIFSLCGGSLMIRGLVNRKFISVDWKKVLDKLQPEIESTPSDGDTDRPPENDLRSRGLAIAHQRYFQARNFIVANPFFVMGIVSGLIYKSFIARRR